MKPDMHVIATDIPVNHLNVPLNQKIIQSCGFPYSLLTPLLKIFYRIKKISLNGDVMESAISIVKKIRDLMQAPLN